MGSMIAASHIPYMTWVSLYQFFHWNNNWIRVSPLPITCVFHILIYHIAPRFIAHKFSNRISGLPSKQPSKDESKGYLKNLKGAKTTTMFVAASFMSWLPYSCFRHCRKSALTVVLSLSVQKLRVKVEKTGWTLGTKVIAFRLRLRERRPWDRWRTVWTIIHS